MTSGYCYMSIKRVNAVKRVSQGPYIQNAKTHQQLANANVFSTCVVGCWRGSASKLKHVGTHQQCIKLLMYYECVIDELPQDTHTNLAVKIYFIHSLETQTNHCMLCIPH